MSHSSSPTNRSSIFGWVKNLKKGNLTSNESLNEMTSDNDNNSSPTKSQGLHPNALHNYHSSSQQEFLRPLLQHKSRSTNNVNNRERSASLNQSEKSSTIRQHRDSFLQTNALIDENSIYFGVPLEEAIKQASAKISILNSDTSDNVLQYGRIPIVVAKCGVFLKNKGLNVEGIFRVGGSSKRLKELQIIFNSPPDFGKKLNWEGYTVHDAASILRRYLNALPEPLVPLEFYELFRDPLRDRPRIINYLKYKSENPGKPKHITPDSNQSSNRDLSTPQGGSESLDVDSSHPLTEANIGRWNTSISSHSAKGSKDDFTERESSAVNTTEDPLPEKPKKSIKKAKNYKKLTRDVSDAINEYKKLLDELPGYSKQLLFYILDLLAMVQNNSEMNLMPSRNLAAIFQPAILSHPDHDMDPIEYALSQLVVEFLIQYAYKLLPRQTPPNSSIQSRSVVSQEDSPIKSSNSPSTENVPKEGVPTDVDKRKLPPFKRHHSKSLSSTNNHDDLIVYPKGYSRKALMLDSENDFGITDDDNENEHDLNDINSLHLNKESQLNGKDEEKKDPLLYQPPTVHDANPNVAIVVSTPSSSDAKGI